MHWWSSLYLLMSYASLSFFTIELGLFDASYMDDVRAMSMVLKNWSNWELIWQKIHLLFIVAFICLFVIGLVKVDNRKITLLDFYFLTIFIGLSIMQSVGMYLTCKYLSPDEEIKDELLVKTTRIQAFSDWSSLPALGWVIAWSRHIRRGWYPKRNRIVFAISTFSFFFTIFHQTTFPFLLSIVGVLSCIAVNEIYKVHFFRAGVKPLFWSVMVANVVFITCRIFEPLAVEYGVSLHYLIVLSSTCVTITLSLMLLNILEDVNRLKM